MNQPLDGSKRVFGRSIRLGRSFGCEVRIDAASVSRIHAEIVFERGSWSVRDLASTNGLFLDGVPVATTERLPRRSRLQLGLFGPVLEVEIESHEAGEVEVAGGEDDCPTRDLVAG